MSDIELVRSDFVRLEQHELDGRLYRDVAQECGLVKYDLGHCLQDLPRCPQSFVHVEMHLRRSFLYHKPDNCEIGFQGRPVGDTKVLQPVQRIFSCCNRLAWILFWIFRNGGMVDSEQRSVGRVFAFPRFRAGVSATLFVSKKSKYHHLVKKPS